jgi:endonuclease/exonuclease/phosphatase family metal-dependent hydrolase
MRLVSYNIQYGKGRDGRFDLRRIANAIREADVIALQEVERYWIRSGIVDQPAELAGLLPDHHWVYGPGLDIDASGRGRAGRLLHRRHPVREHARPPGPARQPRPRYLSPSPPSRRSPPGATGAAGQGPRARRRSWLGSGRRPEWAAGTP